MHMQPPVILSETADYFVINKPAGMATEPPSHAQTLQDWLIESGHIKTGEWQPAERFGVVHRLDSDTSGVIIWAKNKAAQERLRTDWQGRTVKKTYLALVVGECQPTGTIELPIARDNRNDKMKVAWLDDGSARPSITEYKTLALAKIMTPNLDVPSQLVSLVEAHPITGRTHQIRIHFKAIGHPLVGDKLYGEKRTDQLAKQLGISRQFLHAKEICLPNNGGQICYQADLPEDLHQALIKAGIENI